MIKMSIVKWIIFCNKTNDFHNILLSIFRWGGALLNAPRPYILLFLKSPG